MNIKKAFYISLMTISVACYGCSVADEADDPSSNPTSSALLFKIVPTIAGGGLDTLILSGDKIEWYNGTTKEVRFTDNYAISQSIPFSNYKTVKFYINKNYLFSSLMFATDVNSQASSSLVFYYNSTENRFYLKDGYPDVSILSNPEAEQQLRNENRKKIATEWTMLINQLKFEKRYLE
jgi:hypothetical protein